MILTDAERAVLDLIAQKGPGRAIRPAYGSYRLPMTPDEKRLQAIIGGLVKRGLLGTKMPDKPRDKKLSVSGALVLTEAGRMALTE